MASKPSSRALLSSALGVVYGLFYLFMLGDLDIGRSGWSWVSLGWDWQRLFAQRGPWHFEALAGLHAGPLIILLSPLNLLVATLLGGLLALNLHTALTLRAQRQCSLVASSAWSASLWPALLAGGACCAPSLLLLLGIPALGAFIGLFAWLLPLSLLLLVLSLVWQRRLRHLPATGASPVTRHI
jgi:hypothetical protein